MSGIVSEVDRHSCACVRGCQLISSEEGIPQVKVRLRGRPVSLSCWQGCTCAISKQALIGRNKELETASGRGLQLAVSSLRIYDIQVMGGGAGETI